MDRARSFTGWDLAAIRTQPLEPGPSWDYPSLVRESAIGRRSVLDMGTGGGELLASLREALPRRVVATEEWVVNAPVAQRRLGPLGVAVVRCASVRLPFVRAAFDLVINRHEELDPVEVDRVLAPGGELITQQVGWADWQELRPHIPRMADFGDLRSRYEKGFASRGFEVTSVQRDYRVAYPSLREFVFMLAVSPWTIPEFDLVRDLDALIAFETANSSEDGLVVTESRFLIRARKPAEER